MSWSIVAHFAPWLVLAVVLAVASLVWHAERARRRGHPRPYVHSATQHKRSHSVAAVVGVVAFVVILLVGAAALTHSGGGKPDTRRVVHPHLALVGGAGVAPSASVAYLVRYINDQGNSVSCGAQTLTELNQMERLARNENAGHLSPWWTYYWAQGPGNHYTTAEQDAYAIEGHGSTAYNTDAYLGYPPSGTYTDPGSTGGHLNLLYANDTGSDAVLATMQQIDAGHPVGVLMSVYSGMVNAFWTGSFVNGGSFEFTHFVALVGYRSTASGVEFEVLNSWGASWGNGGIAWMSADSFQTVLEGFTWTPGGRAYPADRVVVVPPTATHRPAPTATRRPTPRPTATHRPTATATPRPRPTATPRPRPTATPRPTPAVLYRVTVASTLRAGEGAGTAHVRDGLVKVGWQLRYLNKRSPHWLLVERLDHHARGYIAVDHIALVRHR